MYQNLNCIALRTVRHDERHNILTAWDADLGRVSIALPAGKGRSAARMRALTMPLALFEAVADVPTDTTTILHIRDLRPTTVLPTLSADGRKAAIALFLADVLERVLRAGQPDALLYDFLRRSVMALDALRAAPAIANFHLVFLYRLAYVLGIGPDVTEYRHGCVFDLVAARMRMSPPLHHNYVGDDGAAAVAILARLDWDTAEYWKLTRQKRNAILDGILQYYTLHIAPLASLGSLAVVRDIFGD